MKTDNKKNENSEDIEKIMSNFNEFMIPRFKSFQENISKENIGILKLLGVAKKFVKESEIEYENKYNRNFIEDMNTIKEKYNSNFSFNDITEMFKNVKT